MFSTGKQGQTVIHTQNQTTSKRNNNTAVFQQHVLK